MQKRGQVSVFAIVGIVIVILAGIFFFARSEFGLFISPVSFLNEKSQPIENNLRDCVRDVTRNSLNTFGKQGGDLDPTNYVFYQSQKVTFYCNNIPEKDECLNVMPTYSSLLAGLSSSIKDGVNSCVNKNLARSGLGYDVEAGGLNVEISASGNNLVVRADYDVELTKGEIKQKLNPVVVRFNAPVADLYKVSVDIINSEASVGFFEQLFYMLNKRGQYIINIDKPYPHKVYKIKQKDSDFEFWFAVEGERG